MKIISFLTKVVSSLILVSCFIACNNDNRKDIEAYYFPVDDLEDGLVYEYRPVGQDSIGHDYWYYITVKQDGQTHFVGNYYDAELNVRQLVREEKVENGMLLQDMYLYATDTLGKQMKISVEVQANNAYPFKVSDPSGIFLYKVKWNDPYEEGSHTTLIRNRRYIGDTTYIYQGKTFPAIQIELKELIENFRANDGYAEPQYSGLEVYAKGLGLVYYRKDISEEFRFEYELVDRYPMTVLEKNFEGE